MKIKTNHFATKTEAIKYYVPHFGSEQSAHEFVDESLQSGSIKIGKPSIHPHETLEVENGRYFLVSGN